MKLIQIQSCSVLKDPQQPSFHNVTEREVHHHNYEMFFFDLVMILGDVLAHYSDSLMDLKTVFLEDSLKVTMKDEGKEYLMVEVSDVELAPLLDNMLDYERDTLLDELWVQTLDA